MPFINQPSTCRHALKIIGHATVPNHQQRPHNVNECPKCGIVDSELGGRAGNLNCFMQWLSLNHPGAKFQRLCQHSLKGTGTFKEYQDARYEILRCENVLDGGKQCPVVKLEDVKSFGSEAQLESFLLMSFVEKKPEPAAGSLSR